MAETIPDEQRKQAFRALVSAQDGGMSVEDSRSYVANLYELTESEVRRIERAGIAAQWPPL